MASFFNKFKPGTQANSTAHATTKKDPNAPQPTPLEKLLADAGPLRHDGSDKFFGMENFGNTCYANSIIQCLYYSPPFRDSVINFPSRSPQDVLNQPRPTLPRLNTETEGMNGSATKGKTPATPTAASPVKKPAGTTASGAPGSKPEDNKDSPEYKKKQALSAGPLLNMDYENSNAYGMSESLFTALKDIFEAIIAHQSRMGVVSPAKFLEILRRENEMFRTAMHQDAHEFLNLVLNDVVDNVEKHDANQKKLEASSDSNSAIAPSEVAPSVQSTGWVHSLFEGSLTSETRCLTCETTSHRAEAFLDLSVDLEQNSSVTACLRKFSEEEMLCERNKFHCDTCGGLQEAEKRMKVQRLPKILALHLKRFKYTEDLQRLQKLFHRVVYPYHLRMFNTTDDAEDPDRLYELYAVVVHIGGGPYHGHYVSIIKTPDRGWLLFDDEMVEPVDRSYVRNFFGGDNALACAYVLFYQETTLEAMQREEAEAAAAETGVKAEVNGQTASPNTPRAEDAMDFSRLSPTRTAPLDRTEPVAATVNKLDHTVTEPAPFTNGVHTIPVPPTPVTPTSPLRSVKSDVTSRKEKARLEKERKEAEKARKAADKVRAKEEKEKERLEAIKRREADAKRRETYKQQSEDFLLAVKASKESKAEEDKRNKEREKAAKKEGRPRTSTGFDHSRKSAEVNQTVDIDPKNPPMPASEKPILRTSTGPTLHGRSSHPYTLNAFGSWRNKERQNSSSHGTDESDTKDNGKPVNGNIVSAGLSRFRHSSMSLRHRPKFWSMGSPKDIGAKGSDDIPRSAVDGHDTDESGNMTALPATPGLKDEGKSKFGLGKKKGSTLF